MAELLGLPDVRRLGWSALLERLSALDLTALAVHRIAEVPEDVLVALARQWHVMGLEGWRLATDDTARRGLVSQALELHRSSGTPGAVRAVLEQVGYRVHALLERFPPLRYDAEQAYDGHARHGGARWACFRVLLSAWGGRGAEDQSLGGADLVRALIATRAPVRCSLLDLGWRHEVEEVIIPTEGWALTPAFLQADPVPGGTVHNAGRRYNGDTYYFHRRDSLALTVTVDDVPQELEL
jgi:hypothetical protein